MKRMAIAAVCVGMVGSGGLVQAMNTKKPVEPATVKPLKTGKIKPVMTQMINVPASKIASVPLERDNKITRVNLRDFQIGKAEVTGALWSDVYNWAVNKGYTFETTEYLEDSHRNPRNVGTGKPVTNISWYDVLIWTNAYSEKSELQPVYRDANGKVLRGGYEDNDVLDAVAGEYIHHRYNGYRLPDAQESELVVRWLGTTKPNKGTLSKKAIRTKGKDNKMYYWSPANYASGAIDSLRNKRETEKVAFWSLSVWLTGGASAKTVCTKSTNVLKICDMSGNADEWQNSSYHATYGVNERDTLSSGTAVLSDEATSFSRQPPYIGETDLGFRLARTVK